MPEPVRMYLRYLGLAVRAQLQYPSAFLLSGLGQFVIITSEFVVVWVLFERFDRLPGWSFGQVACFAGVANTGFALADALTTGFDRFGPGLVRTGDFDRMLLRPRSTALQIAGQDLALKRIGRLAAGLSVLAWGIAEVGLAWDLERALMLIWTITGTTAFFVAIVVLQATLSFWTVESLEAVNVLSYGGVATAQYPLDVYPRWFRSFFLWFVPLGCVIHLPLVRVLGVEDPLGSSRGLQAVAPLAGFAFLGLALGAWRVGVRHYTSTGS